VEVEEDWLWIIGSSIVCRSSGCGIFCVEVGLNISTFISTWDLEFGMEIGGDCCGTC